MLAALLQAAAPELPTWSGLIREVLTWAIQALGAIVLTGLGFVAKAAYKYLQEKKNIVVSDDIKARIEDAFTKGVARAQEWGTKTYITDPSDPTKQVPATGEMKKDKALETAIKLEPAVKELKPDVQAAMIDAKLQLLRSALSMPPRTVPGSVPPPPAPDPASFPVDDLSITGRFGNKGPVP